MTNHVVQDETQAKAEALEQLVQSEQLERRERRRSRLAGLRYAAIWLVFLSIPAILIAIYSQAGPVWDWIGYGAIVVFGMIFVVAFALVPEHSLEGELGKDLRIGPFLWMLLALVVPTLLMVPSLQEAIIAILPFYAGYGLFLLPIRRAFIWAGAIAILLVAILLAFNNGVDLGLLLGPLLSIGFIVMIRVMMEWTEIEKRTTVELAAVREREELSRDVHDILGHTLTVVALKTQLAKRILRDDPDRAEAELDQVLEHTQAALDEVRATVGRMRTPQLAAQLASARIALNTKDIGLVVRGSADQVAIEHRAMFAWAIREAVTNVLRHSEASNCTINLERDRLMVSDDGIGLQQAEGNGLGGLRRRIEDANGVLTLAPALVQDESRPGTRLEVSFL